jgi:hypothetical protein
MTESQTGPTISLLGIFGKPPNDHPIYATVGRIAAEWAALEHQLDEIIWDLSEMAPRLASCITSQIMGHAPRFNAIIALLTQHGVGPEIIKLVVKERGRVSELAELRSRRVHDAWYLEVRTGEPHQFRSMPRQELTFGFQPQTPTELETLTRQIEKPTEAINACARRRRAPAKLWRIPLATGASVKQASL